MKKRIITAVLALALCMACAMCLAAEGTFEATRNFLAALDEAGILYTLEGVTEDGENEQVVVVYSCENVDVEVNIFIGQENNYAELYCWNLIDFDAADHAAVCELCSKLNSDWKFPKFFCDENDNSVTCQLSGFLTADCAGAVCKEMLSSIVFVSNSVFPELEPYAVKEN